MSRIATITRLRTKYEREQRRRSRRELWLGVFLMVAPVVVIVWEVM